MSDKSDATNKGEAADKGGPAPGTEAPHKVDQAAQEEAGRERAENEGYD